MHVESIKHLINENDIKELGDLLICAIVWLEKNSPVKHYYYIADME